MVIVIIIAIIMRPSQASCALLILPIRQSVCLWVPHGLVNSKRKMRRKKQNWYENSHSRSSRCAKFSVQKVKDQDHNISAFDRHSFLVIIIVFIIILLLLFTLGSK